MAVRGLRARALCAALFLALVGQARGEVGLLTSALAPQHIAELDARGACYFQTKFVGKLDDRRVQAVVRRNVTQEQVEAGLSGVAVTFRDAERAGVSLEALFAANATVLGVNEYLDGELSPSAVTSVYSGSIYGKYFQSSEHEFYRLFEDGKYKFSGESAGVSSALLACVFPMAWASPGPDGPLDGLELDIVVEVSEFEQFAWNSTLYRAWFQYVTGVAFLLLSFECMYGLRQYLLFSSIPEIKALFSSPVSCLAVNMATSSGMSFIFFSDGWGSTGFLSDETFSSFLTLTRMTTVGTVLMMAIHWMRLRSMIVSVGVNRAKLNGDTEMPRSGSKNSSMLRHMRLIMYTLCLTCLSVDFFSLFFVKLLKLSVRSIWHFLLITIGLLEAGSAIFFTRQANLFAREVSVLVNAKNLGSAANLKYLKGMMAQMRWCSVFLFVSVFASLCIGLLPVQVHVSLWISLWAVAIVCRLGVAHTIVRSSLLNTAGRKRQGNGGANAGGNAGKVRPRYPGGGSGEVPPEGVLG